MVSGQAFEQLVQQGLGIFRPPQDQDMLRGFNGFQTFLLAKLAFNEDRGHGGGDQRQAEKAYDHKGDAHQPAQEGDGDHIPIPHRGQGDHAPPQGAPETGPPLPFGGFNQAEPDGCQQQDHHQGQDQAKDPFPLQRPDKGGDGTL